MSSMSNSFLMYFRWSAKGQEGLTGLLLDAIDVSNTLRQGFGFELIPGDHGGNHSQGK
jgi:hypothetical protein